jgi:prepilin-type N-terminal cleavage/methylation domain-containing protein
MKQIGDHGFSLIEVLASIVILSSAAVATTAVWRLIDQKQLAARLEHRATRILREYYELHAFAPSWADPLSPDYLGGDSGADDPLRGFLYYPLSSIKASTQGSHFSEAVAYTSRLALIAKSLS